MRGLNRILFVANGEDAETEALTKAGALAEANDALLTIMDLSKDQRYAPALPGGGYTVARATELPLADGLRVKIEPDCSLNDAIATASRQDLVVTAAGSNDDAKARKLVRHSTCPIWLVKGRRQEKSRRILAAVEVGLTLDRSGHSRTVLEHAIALAEHEKMELSVVDAWRFERELELRGRLNVTGLTRDTERTRAGQLNVLISKLEGGESVRVTTRSINGDLVTVVSDLVAKDSIDVVVIGESQQRRMRQLLEGNRLERLLKRVDCSVFVVGALEDRVSEQPAASRGRRRRPVARSAHA